ncbi:MAG: HAMP domain-containing sensor histidine kinase [Clostridiaceae bacterium]
MFRFKNKFKITTNFLIALTLIFTIVFFVDIAIISTSFLTTRVSSSPFSTSSPIEFTRSFSKYINFNGEDNIEIDEKGTNLLIKNNGWIQILNEDFSEIYTFNSPKGIPKTYTPISIVHAHKYDMLDYSVYIGEKVVGNRTLSYLIGFPANHVSKYTLEFNPSTVYKIMSGFLIIIILNIIIAIIGAYLFFGRKMGKPLDRIVEGIDELSQGNYERSYKEYGIYKNVFSNLNNLNLKLKESKIKREELDIMREDWISSISHDIKTPLSSIKGFAEIMKDKDYDFSKEEILDYSDIIWSKSCYIETLIEDLNLTYKLKNNSTEPNKLKFNIVFLIQNTIIEILNDPMYSTRNINFETSNETIYYFGDEALLKRAFSNLIINSIVHNSNDVKVLISVHEDENNIYLNIKDNGKGISSKDLPYIFERYYRGTNTTSSKEGSGLGMAIAKEIIIKHGGNVSIKSEIGRGTEIKISFLKNIY